MEKALAGTLILFYLERTPPDPLVIPLYTRRIMGLYLVCTVEISLN